MKQAKDVVSRFRAITLISAIFCVGLAMFPSSIAADIVSVQTQQVIPAGGNTCVPLSAYNFTPYIYDGALHSFSFTIPDSSYVALAGTVGDTSIPFQLMTRSGTVDNLQIHVDIDTTSISGTLPLSVTLMSVKDGQSVCMSVVLMEVPGLISPTTVTVIPPTYVPAPIGLVPQTITEIKEAGEVEPVDIGTTSPEVAAEVGSSTEDVIPFTIGSMGNKIVELCLAGNTSRLWILLVATYAVIAIVAVFAQLPAPQVYSLTQRTATVLVPLALLAAFWFFSEACRVSLWAPVASVLIALLSLVGIYWNDPRTTPYTGWIKKAFGGETSPQKALPIPHAKDSRAIVTPPPIKKPDA